MGEESVLLCRDREEKIHVFLNSCRHRGMKVCRYDEGNTPVFTCPYHGWTYDLETGVCVAVLPEGPITVADVAGLYIYDNMLKAVRINGAPVGFELRDWHPGTGSEDTGSIIIVVGNDAPMLDRVLGRVARRAALGLARTGSSAAHGSGDYIIAFSNGLRIPHEIDEQTISLTQVSETGPLINSLFQATIEATEEAIYNSLCMAETMIGYRGNVTALPFDKLTEIIQKYKIHL
jgi:L-aminopeptidase/D-esterase-like protein